jgi:hypothetical protein
MSVDGVCGAQRVLAAVPAIGRQTSDSALSPDPETFA